MIDSFNENTICVSCQKQFKCGANAENCWCFEIELTSETSAKLRESYKDCLCVECLLELETTSLIVENEKLFKDTT